MSSFKYEMHIEESRGGCGYKRRIGFEDLEDAEWLAKALLKAEKSMYGSCSHCGHTLQEIIIFDSNGNDVVTPLSCRG